MTQLSSNHIHHFLTQMLSYSLIWLSVFPPLWRFITTKDFEDKWWWMFVWLLLCWLAGKPQIPEGDTGWNPVAAFLGRAVIMYPSLFADLLTLLTPRSFVWWHWPKCVNDLNQLQNPPHCQQSKCVAWFHHILARPWQQCVGSMKLGSSSLAWCLFPWWME